MDRYDMAIIGTGPAGLSAAITAKVRNKKVILFGTRELSTKIGKAHAIQNYLGLPEVTGENMQKAFLSHIDTMQIAVTEERVNAVYPMGDWFSIQTGEQMYEADAIILATGVVMEKPYPGESEFLGRGVSYCATCDAPLYKKKTVAVVAFGKHEEAEADFLAEVASKVYYFPMYKDDVSVSGRITVVREKPVSVTGTAKVEQLKTETGEYEVDGVFILRESIAPGQLIPGIEVCDNHVKTDRLMQTSMPGVFACGDIVGKPYQYIKSAGEGNVAALSAVSYIDERKRAAAK
jgi:Thioredoxin reductase